MQHAINYAHYVDGQCDSNAELPDIGMSLCRPPPPVVSASATIHATTTSTPRIPRVAGTIVRDSVASSDSFFASEGEDELASATPAPHLGII